MKRVAGSLLLLASVAIASAQNYGITPQQLAFLDDRYGSALSSLTTNTIFGAFGNVSGLYNTLTYTETDPVFGPWLASFSATNVPGSTYSADTTTVTNNGSGQISVKNYDTNAAARTFYLRNNRDTLLDYQAGNVNASTLGEMTNGGPMAQTLAQLVGP